MEGRRDAIIIIVLSTIVGLSGNAFLGLTGALCGTMVLCGNLERAPDMIAMLSFATSLLAAIWSIMVLPVGIVLITASPQRLCAASQQMLGYINPTPADSTAPVGYPWNMTEASHPTYTAFSPKLLGTTQRISGMVCGEDAGMFTALVGLGALLYFCGVCLPLMYLSGRLMRTARRAGGCNDCASGPQVIVMPQRMATNPQFVNAPIAVGRPTCDPSGAPQARAVPVQGMPARGAAAPSKEMH